MEKKMIWSSEMLYDDEARENYLENMRAITENKDYQLTDEEWADEVYLGLSDERGNLDKKVNGIIIAFADLGLWQGRRNAFQFFGNNIANILHTRCEDAEWYGDAYNIRGILHHHDGTNYVLYRIAKDEETAERIAAKIYQHHFPVFHGQDRRKRFPQTDTFPISRCGSSLWLENCRTKKCGLEVATQE